MYYSVEEIKVALDKATKIINNRTKYEGFQRKFSDCYSFLVEYDRLLRGKTKAEDILDFEYKDAKEFLIKLYRKGYDLKSFAAYCGYELQTKPRPMLGDIAFMNGDAMIAGDSCWVTTCELGRGVQRGRLYTHFERRLNLLARPLRS